MRQDHRKNQQQKQELKNKVRFSGKQPRPPQEQTNERKERPIRGKDMDSLNYTDL